MCTFAKKKTCSEETVAKKKKHFFSFKEDPTAGGVARGWDLTLFFFFFKIKKNGGFHRFNMQIDLPLRKFCFDFESKGDQM